MEDFGEELDWLYEDDADPLVEYDLSFEGPAFLYGTPCFYEDSLDEMLGYASELDEIPDLSEVDFRPETQDARRVLEDDELVDWEDRDKVSHHASGIKDTLEKNPVALFFAGVGSALVGVAAVFLVMFLISLSEPAPAAKLQFEVNSNPTQVAADEDASLAETVAEKCLPSVVSIQVEAEQAESSGSGIVLDKEGHILTNSHVIEGAKNMTVTVGAGEATFAAQLVGSDPSSDIAVLKIDPDGVDLVPITFGNSDDVKVGEWVMVLGSPFGLDQSVSTGIVSSLYRSTVLASSTGTNIYANLIQTDAAVNPGNSGGALVNASGNLIGVNSIISSTSGSSAGVGFAIPSNYAKKIATSIIEGKTIEHAWLGVNVTTVTPSAVVSSAFGVSGGALVESVVPGSSAANAGIQAGDVIVKVGDIDVASSDGLILAVRQYEPGAKVPIKLWRDGKTLDLEVTLGSDANAPKETEDTQQQGQGTQGGQQTMPLTEDMLRELLGQLF